MREQRMNLISLLVIFVWMFSLPCCFCGEVEMKTESSKPIKTGCPWLKAVLESVAVSNATSIAEWTKRDTRGLLEAASIFKLGERDKAVPWFPIIAIWINGPRSLVELLWLEKDDRETRTLIMLLVLSDTEDDALGSYLIKCDRYEPVERTLRKEEINAVATFRREYSEKVLALVHEVRVIRTSWYQEGYQEAPPTLSTTIESSQEK